MDKKTNIMPIIIITIIVMLAGITALYIYMNSPKNSYIAYKSKLNSERDLVYDAEYTSEIDNTSYKSDATEETYSTDNIVVPYININSEDVTLMNNQIKSLYNEFISIYSECLNSPWYIKTNYKTYTNKNVLSLLIEKETGGTYEPEKTYYSYNLNLSDLKEMSYSDLCSYIGKSREDVNNKIEHGIKKYMETLNPTIWDENNKIDYYIKQSVDNYNQSVENKDIQAIINENNRLTEAVRLIIPSDIGEKTQLIVVE